MSERTALLLGATGLVGGHCLEMLLQDEHYEHVATVGRRPAARVHRKLKQHVVDFKSPDWQAHLPQAHDIFCCLGTTIKNAGSREAFRKVDYEYPLEVGRVASQNGAEQFLLVSSLGADARSSVFYSRVKGEIEDAISELPFDGVQIFRPSLLLGERKERRTGERVAETAAKLFSFMLRGSLKKYRPVEASAVAAAMIRVAKQHPKGVNVFESDQINLPGNARQIEST